MGDVSSWVQLQISKGIIKQSRRIFFIVVGFSQFKFLFHLASLKLHKNSNKSFTLFEENADLNMKNILLIVLILLPGLLLKGQVISGLVLDQESREPIDFASVFFNGTFVGTTTDEQGRFELDISKYATRSLTISAVGYAPASISEFDTGKQHLVELVRQLVDIGEVTVSTKSLVRKRRANMRIFRNEFIGLSVNARKCHILNEEDITFNYASDRDTLKAIASAPIVIQNLSLGYIISYHLERFEYVRKTKTMLFTGSIIFNSDLIHDEESKQHYERRRGNAYIGSCQHFFRALWANSLIESEFALSSTRSGSILAYDIIVYEDFQGKKYLRYFEDLSIEYYAKLSHIHFVGDKVFFQQDGYFDPTPIIWTGNMAQQRVADFLPYEYIFNE